MHPRMPDVADGRFANIDRDTFQNDNYIYEEENTYNHSIWWMILG